MGYKVLVVEDDAFLTGAYRVKLTKEGFEVEIAIDGEEALVKLRDFVPDVILMDIVMPRKDGFATLQDIKSSETLKNIPVIMATNLGQQGDIEKAKALGAVDLVTKSDTSMADLVTKIKTVIAASKK
jgi:two-component system alkaline phosphatase synthesis response regulator PhoP